MSTETEKKTGRPTKRSPETVAKLEEAFSLGSTVVGACLYAGIGKNTYYRWCEEDPEFRDRMELLKETQVLSALKTVKDNIDDPKIATWLLEKKHPEFKPKHVLEGNPDAPLEVAGDILYKRKNHDDSSE